MVKDLLKQTSQFVPEQFPSLYLTDGPQFVQFVKSFYGWMDLQGPNYKARRLFELRDIDETTDDLVKYFVSKYMVGIPVERLGDKRFLQKHILDIYRSKGSVEGLRLLFRFLYGEEIEIYIPSRDMLAPSDGTWAIPRYMEISYSPDSPSFFLQNIYGVSSGATAIVEDYIVRSVRGKSVYVLYLSNIDGDFDLYEGLSFFGFKGTAPIILGSVTSVEVTSGSINSALGDPYNAYDDSGLGLGLQTRASDLTTSGDGYLNFALVFGGFGYTLTSTVDVVAGGLLDETGEFILDESNEYLDILPGTGASFTISGITNLASYVYDTVIIAPYDGDSLSDSTILYNLEIMGEDTTMLTTTAGDVLLTEGIGSTINDLVLISDWEGLYTFQGGTITSILNAGNGSGYIADADVIITELNSTTLFVNDGLGGYIGSDAVATASVIAGVNIMDGAVVSDSGFGYSDGEPVTFYYTVDGIEGLEFTDESGVDITFTGKVNLSAIGSGQGQWTTTNGFLNADKYIQDSFYYQDYSYDVGSSRSLGDYEAFLKKVYHPAGAELFGTAILSGGSINAYTTLSEVDQS